MAITAYDERAYFQRRLREEMARCQRYHDVFTLVTLQAKPSGDRTPTRRSMAVAARLLERRLRTCDVVDAVYEDMVAVLLIGTGVNGIRDAEQRIRGALVAMGGTWELRKYAFPEQTTEIEQLELVLAA
jgi:hypothetical protein